MSGTASLALQRLSDQLPHDRAARSPATIGASTQPTEHQGTRWRGASQTLRTLSSWLPTIGSPTSDLPSREQRTMRARSRDAHRGNMLARAVISRCRTNIVGVGLVCRPSVDAQTLGLTPEQAEVHNTALRTAWERWAEDPLECDWEATHDIYGLQALSLVSAMCSGDVFGLTPQRRNAGGVCELKLQLIEADRCSNPHDLQDTANLIDGIELRDGMPSACHIRSTHPGDLLIAGLPTWQRIEMFGGETGRRRVLHIWNEKDRPGQVRGAPFLAPILEPLKQIDRYSGAELMAAVISAMLTVFIEKSAEQFDPDGNAVEAVEGTQGNTLALGQGAILDLAPGEKANPVNPARPNANFDPFFGAIVKQIGAALELPVDELLLQYNASYSAARAAMLQAWRFYTMRRWWLVQQLCQPLYGLLLDEEVASGRLSLPGYADPIRRRAWSRAMWIGPARGAMDEHREANAAKTRIEIGVSNEAMETAAMSGEDWTAVYDQRLREINQRKKDGIWVDPSPRGASVPEDPNRQPA
jgi:lambda family phage portal protein